MKDNLVGRIGYIEIGCCLGLRYVDMGRYKIIIPGINKKYELKAKCQKDP